MATPLVVNVVELLRWPGTTKDVVVDVAADVVDSVDSSSTLTEAAASSSMV